MLGIFFNPNKNRWQTSGGKKKIGGFLNGTAPDDLVTKEQLDQILDGTIDLTEVKTADGTAAAPSHTFVNQEAVGMYRSASNVLGFATAGSERVTIDAQGDINIAGGRGVNSLADTDMWATFISTDAQNNITAGTGGAIVVTNYLTTINTDAGGDAFTLANGTQIGQLKKILLVVDGGGDGVITPTSLSGGTTITMNDAGDYVILLWNGTSWFCIENSGCTIA